MKLAEIMTGPETWVQGSFGLKDTPKCLVGAFICLNEAQEIYDLERPRLDRAIAAVDPSNTDHATIWNDRPGRTWDEVAAVVDAYDRDRMLNP